MKGTVHLDASNSSMLVAVAALRSKITVGAKQMAIALGFILFFSSSLANLRSKLSKTCKMFLFG